MTEHEASRTLVKSPPELWAECSDAGSLTRHLSGSFGEIRITRLEPETTVAWEGENVSGTVRLEPSGWGTRVVLTAEPAIGPDVAESPEEPGPSPLPEPEPTPEPPPDPLPPAAGLPSAAGAPSASDQPIAPKPAPPAVPAPEPPAAGVYSDRPRPRGLFARLLERFKAPEPVAAREPVAVPEPVAVREPVAPREAAAPAGPVAEPEALEHPEPSDPPDPPDPPEPSDPPDPVDLERAQLPDPGAILTAALDSLGQAHHRPYSRA